MSAHDNYLDPDRYGLFDEQEDNSTVEDAFSDYDGPGGVYWATYKYTDCGPSVGFLFEYIEPIEPDGFNDYPGEKTAQKWVYCSDLYKWGTWKTLAEQGVLVREISVSSIVEGVDYDTSTHIVSCRVDDLEKEMTEDEAEKGLGATLRRLFEKAVDDVNEEANSIWMDTHGCDHCAQHWADDSGVTLEVVQNQWDSIPVWTECPNCEGTGAVI